MRICVPTRGRRGQSGAGPQERRETGPPIVPAMRDRETVQVPPYQEDKLDKILEAIAATGQDLRNRVDVVAIEDTLLREDLKKLSAGVISAESDLRVFRPSLMTMEEMARSLANKVQELECRAEDSVGRSTCNNIRMVRKEQKRSDPIQFFEAWLAQSVGK
ncbi:hypothetical protein NDU88_000900 [Pleurodeles waltl]|uniref:Uncharacterized protein n=1 Tax=Pleurodeles waltl TaxID=8319 RepID=A0AAV7UR97_PLEWA|nr:hypothetical protein NDU88_000900 [Pleurodeles waltl]